MPVLENRNYVHPKLLFNGHLQTIVPAVLRKSVCLPFERERISTHDEDFLDLDWLKSGSDKLVVISHGLEGNSRRPYMLGMANIFFKNGWDVLNWNFRGCSGCMNKAPFFYHSGATYDLDKVVSYAQTGYKEIYLVGFSLGGNLTLKYLGESHASHEKVKKAVTISVPLALGASCDKISRPENRVYSSRFLKSLKGKVLEKAKLFPDQILLDGLAQIRKLREFDDHYTGPLHGFSNAEDYYDACSSLYFLDKISIPVLILNAKNDPFLSEECFPEGLGRKLPSVFMEFPESGGHVGFSPLGRDAPYWSEKRAFDFMQTDY